MIPSVKFAFSDKNTISIKCSFYQHENKIDKQHAKHFEKQVLDKDTSIVKCSVVYFSGDRTVLKYIGNKLKYN